MEKIIKELVSIESEDVLVNITQKTSIGRIQILNENIVKTAPHIIIVYDLI